MEIVVDEWIIHHIRERDKNGPLFVLLSKIFRICDNFVTVDYSPLMKKIYEVMRESSNWNDPRQIGVWKYFLRYFFRNSDKFIILDVDVASDLSREETDALPDSDHFLFEIAKRRNDSIIVTTDEKLMKAVVESNLDSRYNMELLRDFVENYGSLGENSIAHR